MQFQGRSDLRYEHVLCYDPEEQDKFLYDNKAEKTGLESAIDIINNDLNNLLSGKVYEGGQDYLIDHLLMNYYSKKVEAGDTYIGLNVIKGVSEALLLAAASCFERIMIYKAINQ